MDIELSRLRHNKRSGYQRLESTEDETPAAANDNSETNRSHKRMYSRTYGANDKGKGKGKGKARYEDEAEDEVDLLRADELQERYTDDIETQNAEEPPQKVPMPSRDT